MTDKLGLFAPVWNTLNTMRVYIFLGMSLVISIPLIFVMQNSYHFAYERELEKVEQSHLVIAENLASTLQRYADDVKSTFDFITSNYQSDIDPKSLEDILQNYNFQFIAEFDSDTNKPTVLYSEEFETPSYETIDALRKSSTYNSSVFSGVMQSSTGPVLYLTRLMPDEALWVGAIDTSYLIAQQKEIAFGERGHSMIVDQNGRVIAHPKNDWVQSSKDVSGLKVVQKMTTGQTGVHQFFAPPLKADVIAGYTFVPSTGWGAMVPQPISELEQAARVEAARVIEALVLMFLAAALASWLVAGLIARPVQVLSRVVTEVRSGNYSERVPEFTHVTPVEISSLRSLLNGLLESWSDNREMMHSSLKAAQEANRHKSESISILSHEMRTPLNGIVGSLELIKNTDLTEMQSKYLGFITTSTSTLLDHVNSVLEVSRLDNSNVKINKKCFSIPDLIREIVQENSAQAERLGCQISLSFFPRNMPGVETDPRLLRKVLANLISNAVKFAPAGEIFVSTKLSSEDILEIVVRDTGLGIHDKDTARIFEPFTTIDASYGRQYEGTGLGLSIVATSIEALGGKISLKSKVGSGSEFTVCLPVCVTSKPADTILDVASAVNQGPEMHSVSKAKRVLVVDDNEINRVLLSHMLEQMGHSASTAADGLEALEQAGSSPFDLILLDISMPDMDGTEVAKLLRERVGPNQNTTIIAQTAHASPQDRDRIFVSGIQSILTKPVSIKTLQASFDRLEEARNDRDGDVGMTQPVLEEDKLQILIAAKGAPATDESFNKLFGNASSIIETLKENPTAELLDANFILQVHNATGACAVMGTNLLHHYFFKIEDYLKSGRKGPLLELLDAAEQALEQTRSAASSFFAKRNTPQDA